MLFNKYGVEQCFIELVESFPCETKNHLNAREGFYIKNNACVNKVIAGRTDKEWREDSREQITEYKKQWRQNNPEKLKIIKHSYYEKKYRRVIKEIKRMATKQS